jgi:hypothetical protein
MAQRLKANTHVNFNDSLHVPEEGRVVHSDTYVPSSSSVSSSSLDDESQTSDHEGRFQYPQELLGMSWGSYLHSGPPTRVQTSTKAKGAAVVSDPPTKHNTVTDSQPAERATNPDSGAETEVHGILRTLQVPVNDDVGKETTKAIKHPDPGPAKTVKLVCEVDNSKPGDNQLYLKLQALVKSLTDCNVELERYGLETMPLESPKSLLLKLERDRRPGGDNNKDAGSLRDKMIHDVVDYLGEMAKKLAKQGRKLNEQALFLQRTGKQLGRNQQSFMEEQALLTQAAERAQEQLMVEKVKVHV